MFRKILFLSAAVLVTCFSLNGSVAYAADTAALYISPLHGQFVVGETFVTHLWLKPGPAKVDTVVADVIFPEDFLEVEAVTPQVPFTKKLSTFGFDNESGTVTIALSAIGGVRQDVPVAEILFRAKQVGGAVPFFKTGARLLAAGQDVPFEVSLMSRYELIEPGVTDSQDLSWPSQTDSAPDAVIDDQLVSIRNEISPTSSAFKGDTPTLRGTTVPGARVYIDVDSGLTRGYTRAAGDGTWEWSLSDEVLPGVYNVKVVAVHPRSDLVQDIDLTSIEVVRLEVAQTLFSISLDPVPDRVLPGEQMTLKIVLSHSGSTEDEQAQTPARLRYYIEGPAGSLFLENEPENVVIAGQEEVIEKQIDIPKDAEKGKYTAYATVALNDNVIGGNSKEFFVGKTPWRFIIGGIGAAGIVSVIVLVSRKKR